jgi:hypothetical protein
VLRKLGLKIFGDVIAEILLEKDAELSEIIANQDVAYNGDLDTHLYLKRVYSSTAQSFGGS